MLENKIEADKKIFDNENQDPRLIGVSSKGKDNKIIVNKGLFTSCDNNENCPPWAIYAEKIVMIKIKNS